MQRQKIGRSGLMVVAGLLMGSPLVSALEIEPGVGVGALYTDNARLTAHDEDNDVVTVGYAGARIDENTGPFRFNAEAELIHLHYTKSNYGNQLYPGLRTTAGWEQIRDRLDWQAQNYFTQQLGNSLEGTTPSNIQNTNVFTFGPNMRFPISGRQSLTVNPQYRNFYYEDVGTNNQQYTVSANWFYQMYRTFGMGLNGSVTKVDYDGGDNQAADYTQRVAHAGLSGTTARSVYSLNLGGTDINRDKSGSTSGFSGDLSWLYHLTGRSSATLYMATELTNTGNLLLNSQVNPDQGGYSNVQTSDNVVRNNIMRLTYRRVDATLESRLWSEVRNLNYKGGQSDRDVREVGADLNYHVTALLSTGIFGSYTWTRETDSDSDQKYYSLTGTVGYQLSRKLRTTFDLRYQNQDSNGGSVNEYSEFSAFVRLVYGFARVERPGFRGR